MTGDKDLHPPKRGIAITDEINIICPKCGSTDVIVVHVWNGLRIGGFAVCRKCGYKGDKR